MAATSAPTNDTRLKEIVSRLVDTFEPLAIYLFGSKARGNESPDSDYDLLVLVPDDAPPGRRRSRLADEALRGTGTAVDVVVWTRSGFESRVHIPASLPATVLREGKPVYGP